MYRNNLYVVKIHLYMSWQDPGVNFLPLVTRMSLFIPRCCYAWEINLVSDLWNEKQVYPNIWLGDGSR